jgi:3-dehydroquinate synthase
VVALPYPVSVEVGALDQLGTILDRVAPGHRIAVITDNRVATHFGLRVRQALPTALIYTITAGEQYKTRETWSRLTDQLLDANFARDTVIVAVGGGVVGDLAGFVAATYMRGVPFVQVPTTLLAMVDASIGGKTGVDTPAGKNLVGAFHQPVAVVVDPEVLVTLPAAHLFAGFAEVVKHGVIADAAYFDQACAFLRRAPTSLAAGLEELTRIIRRSIEIKTAIVERDEREAGLRKVLNFGHTIGHAIEAATDFATLHGEAVAIGLVVEARVAERLGVAEPGTARTIESACQAARLPTTVPAIPVETLIKFTQTDKKRRAGLVEYALPIRIGAMAGAERGWTLPVDERVVREALAS